MAKILQLIEGLSFGGAARGVFAAAKYSKKLGGHEHTLMPISLAKCDLSARKLAEESGLRVVIPTCREEMMREIEAADVVQINWWNSPEIDAFLRSPLPPMRLVGWLHVGGHIAPQVVTPELLDYLDVIVPTSPHAQEAPAIQALSAQDRTTRVKLAYGPADFSRLDGFTPKAHTGFNVGYIGTISFQKMHPDYVRLSAAVDIPNVKFVVCGSGGAEDALIAQAKELGASSRFDIRGYVQDILPVLETMDAYGYPLCEDTYASSELNLQEVMYARIPPVVFPAGGVKHLVINNVTGFVVHSALEYKQALEYLYKNPAERTRIGDAAHQYAQRIFGAENAALKLNNVYDDLLKVAKKSRRWSDDIPPSPTRGAEAFVRSLGRTRQGNDFNQSLNGKELEKILDADLRIARSSDLLTNGGINNYRAFYPNDPYLNLWLGLTNLVRGDAHKAAGNFLESAQKGMSHWRVLWYLAIAAEKAGEAKLANDCMQALDQAAPGFASTHKFT